MTKTAPPATKTPGKTGPKPKPFDYSREKVAFRNPADFAVYLAGYPDVTGLLGYFYRLKPRIDLTLIALKDSFIHKSMLAEEMTAEYCAATWGQGRYMVKLNDANKPAGHREVARTWFDIDDPDTPPVYDPRSLLVNDPENADEVARLISLGVLKRDGEYGTPRIRTDAPAAPVVIAPAPVAPAFAGNIGDQLIIKLLDRALPSATPQTATDVLEQSFQIADRLRPPVAAVAAVPTLDQIADAVALRLRPAAVAPAGIAGELETYERVSSLLDKIGVGRGGGDGTAPAAPGWAVVLGPILDSFLKPLVPLLTGFLVSKSAPAPPVARAGVPVPVALPVPNPIPVFLTADAPLMDRVVQVSRLALQKSSEGVAGFRFASWLCGFYPGGGEVYEFLDNAGGTGGCLGLMAMVPELQSQLADPVRSAEVEVWLDDFFTYESAGQEVEATA